MSASPSVALRAAVLAAIGVLLTACGGETAPPPSTATPATSTEASTGTGAETEAAVASAAARAEAALRADRLFAPPGDNAFELFVLAAEGDQTNSLVRAALDDLVPYAVLHVEQRAAARDREEAERVLGLIERAQPQAPALPRLRREVQALAAAPTAPAVAAPAQSPTAASVPAAAAPSAATASPTPAPAAVSSPAPLSPPAADTPAPTGATAAPATVAARPDSTDAEPPVPSLEPAAPATAVTQTAAARPASSQAQPRIPELVQRPPPRYPPLAERRRIEGEVELEFTIAADGSVTEIAVIRAEPEGIFEREAIGALQRWRYARPDAPVRARRTLEFRLSR
jgi:protein TonB